jgi:hypothetical protein
MPLPCVVNGKANQCTAKSKRSGVRCKGIATVKYGVKGDKCRFHGGVRKPDSIKRGKEHPAYRHGQGTREAKAAHKRDMADLKRLEADMKKSGLIK